jgi:hypothetical protein
METTTTFNGTVNKLQLVYVVGIFNIYGASFPIHALIYVMFLADTTN